MNKKEFASKIFLIFEDRGIKAPSREWLDCLYLSCSKFSDDNLNKGFKSIFSISQEDWNKKYGFSGKPAIADWLAFFRDKKDISPEQLAQLEIETILQKISGYYAGNIDFVTNKITAKTIKSYTSKSDLSKALSNLAWQLYDNDNPNKKDLRWTAKDLKELWLNYYHNKPESVKSIEQNNMFNKVASSINIKKIK